MTLDSIQDELERGDVLPGRAADLPWSEIFTYHPQGFLVWKKVFFQNKRAGKIAGWRDKKGYHRVKINGYAYSIHRIIWEMHNGKIPTDKQIDHVDRNKGNNKIQNLRLVTAVENCQNKNRRKDNKSGATGVHWHSTKNKWVAYVSVDKKLKHLGHFDFFEEAKEARDFAVKNYNYLV